MALLMEYEARLMLITDHQTFTACITAMCICCRKPMMELVAEDEVDLEKHRMTTNGTWKFKDKRPEKRPCEWPCSHVCHLHCAMKVVAHGQLPLVMSAMESTCNFVPPLLRFF